MDNYNNQQNVNNQYQQNMNNQFQNPNYNSQPMQYQNTEPMTIGNWLVMFLVFLVPLVNIVMLFVWAFGEGNVNRKNFCKASLIWAGIVLVLYIIMIIAFGGFIFSMINSGIMY